MYLFCKEVICKNMDDDISITKVIPPKKKPTKWVSSSFDDFAGFTSYKATSSTQSSECKKVSQNKKRPYDSLRTEPVHRFTTSEKGKVKNLKCSQELWADKHKPQTKGDLAVHKKKVEDVENWLRDRTQKVSKGAPILLLTGPAGVGKTATVRVLCKELGLEVQEWINPTQTAYNSEQPLPSAASFQYYSKVESGISESQVSQFKSFLLRANKYTSLQIGDACSSSRKIIFIEELPNIFFRDSSLFHSILRKYRQVGRCPLVFIISDTTSGESSERQLFPVDLQSELHVDTITFNPVAPTMMIKVLARVTSIEYSQGNISSIPSSPVIESIALSSAGDVRSAINAAHFACRRDTFDLKRKTTSRQAAIKKSSSSSGRRLKYSLSQKQDNEQDAEAIGARDTSCFLFHAIGKVLYSKRGDPSDDPDHCKLPAHLSHHDRDPLLLNPEEVIEKSHLSGNYFTSFLHQNYVEFYSDMDDLVRASQYISDADFFTSEWSSRVAMEHYAASIATRGIIHSNSQYARHDVKRTGQGWRPIHKSQWFNVRKQSLRNADTACALFKGYHWEPKLLCTEILPFVNVINITLHSPGQISYIQEICRYSRMSSAHRNLERLDEKDVLGIDDDSMSGMTSTARQDEITLSQSTVQVAADDEEIEDDDVHIDDYDDEEYADLFLSDDDFT